MKALFFLDDINKLHWSTLKSVLFALSLLPLSQVIGLVFHAADALSQIMIGFMALSLFSVAVILSFYSALQATLNCTLLNQTQYSPFEHKVVMAYRYVPMFTLTTMVCYLAATLEF